MTDINKARAFAKECLKWRAPQEHQRDYEDAYYIESKDGRESFDVYDRADVQHVLEIFLGNRFFIQINRGTSSLFKWSVIVGLQNRSAAPPVHDHGRGEGDDMLDAVFDACVAAAHLFPSEDANLTPDAI